MDDFLQNHGHVWLAAGVAFMLLEAFGLPGVGLVFAGLGALMAGLCIFSGVLTQDQVALQFTVFFLASMGWALLLWKPMQKLRVGSKHKGTYNNIVGGTAYVGSNGITRKHGGEVTWSGTIMRAELCPSCGDVSIAPGAQVVITALTGATLIVKQKD